MLSAIVVAAGRSNRFSRFNSSAAGGGIPPGAGKGKISKVILKITSKPIIYYSLYALSKHPDVHEIIVVANDKNIKEIAGVVGRFKIKKVKKIILGGKERQDSVLNGLNSLNPKTAMVLIHDGARPFINKDIISSVLAVARKSGAAVAGVPVRATIKSVVSPSTSLRVDGERSRTVSRQSSVVSKTLNRENLWEIQTPQVFKKDLILAAYEKFGNRGVTDDAALVEKLGVKVRIVLGSYNNIKITNSEDLIIAKGIARKWKCG